MFFFTLSSVCCSVDHSDLGHYHGCIMLRIFYRLLGSSLSSDHTRPCDTACRCFFIALRFHGGTGLLLLFSILAGTYILFFLPQDPLGGEFLTPTYPFFPSSTFSTRRGSYLICGGLLGYPLPFLPVSPQDSNSPHSHSRT